MLLLPHLLHPPLSPDLSLESDSRKSKLDKYKIKPKNQKLHTPKELSSLLCADRRKEREGVCIVIDSKRDKQGGIYCFRLVQIYQYECTSYSFGIMFEKIRLELFPWLVD
jgi:hypothetical protein